MPKKLWIMFLVLSMVMMALTATICHADNPVVQTKYTADPAPMVYNDTVFLYTGHDEDDATSFKMKNYLLYTTTDMANWTDRGIVASLNAFSWADPNNGAWASQCIYRNGKFYWYCAVQLRGIGVLVSTSPYGPFTDPLGKPLINNSSDDIDPTVWIDDDGQAYMYWGNPNCYYVKLNQDMISYSGGITKISSRPSDYQEGPWFHKRNGIYYLSYSSTCCPEGIGYAMSNSPTGPWTWKGKIMDPNSASSGNQPGIIDYKGTTYCFGFNYAINYLRTTVHNERRSVCVDVMRYNADGTIQKMPWWSTSGPPQIGALNPYVQTEAETICYAWDVKTEVCGEGGMDVCNIENGDYIKVKGVDFGTGATSFNARVSSATSGGNIEIRLDSQTGTLVGTCAVSGTGGWQTWVTKSCNISGASGVHDLFFKFTGGSGSLMNFNWWKFNGGSGTPTPIPTPTRGVTPTPTPTPIPGTISIAAGSSSAVGNFQADQYYSGGSVYSNSNNVDVSQITSNPPPAALFNNERYGAMSYTIQGFTAGSSYTVTLYFAETYLTSSGSRLFSVSINGATVLSNFDIYASAGGQNKAIARSFTSTANSSGQIVIQFTSGTENPKINGISIRPGASNTPTPTPTIRVIPTVTPTPTRQGVTPTPTPGRAVRYEAESAARNRCNLFSSGNCSNGQYVGQIDYSDSYVQFTVNVPTTKSYTMTVRYANGTGANSTHNLSVNGGASSTVTYLATGNWFHSNSGASLTISVNLNAGSNTIRFTKGSTGYAELDYINIQ